MTDAAGKNSIDLTANIVSAYLSNNPTPASEIPNLISQVHAALLRVSTGRADTPLEPAKPAVSVKKSMTPDYLVCLEDGKRFKSLKRHLRTQYNMTPEQYRDKWGLPPDYPMVAPNYAVARSQLAKKMGLGQQRAEAEVSSRSSDDVRTPPRAPRAHRSGCARPWSAGRWSAAASDAREIRIRRTPRSHRSPGFAAACGRNRASAGSRSARARYGRRCRRDSSGRGSLLPLRSICFESQTWLAQPCTLLAAECSASGIGSSVRPSSMTYR